jgi:glycerol uptake operon antiterminator
MQKYTSVIDLVARSRVIPMIENRVQFAGLLKQSARERILMLHHCNVLELSSLIEQAQHKGYTVYVNIDHANGIHADAAGIHYLVDRLHIAGIESTNAKVLALAKSAHLATILHIYAADSAGLESALDAADPQVVDLLDISPALAIPYIHPSLSTTLPLPFVGSGLLSTAAQLQAVLAAGAVGVLVTQADFAVIL